MIRSRIRFLALIPLLVAQPVAHAQPVRHSGRLLVKFRGAAPPAVIPIARQQDIVPAVVALSANPAVEFAEEDLGIPPDLTPNDPSFPSQWHLTKISAPLAWDTSTGANIVIAICDTGCDPSHPDLAAAYVPGWNFYDGTSDTHDVYGHGTATAGTAAAVGNNGVGVAGVAFGARIMPLRISDASGYGYYSTAASAIQYAADHGARVVNLSYQMSTSSSVQSAAQYAAGKGTVVCISAGNDGTTSVAPDVPQILTVGSTNQADAISTFSTRGSIVDLYAPGESILTTNGGGGYGWWSGTSFSSPIVAGEAAVCFAAHPGWTAADCILAIKSGCDIVNGVPRANVARAVGSIVFHAADTTPPIVAITSPSDGSTIGQKLTVQVSASDDVGVTSVALYVDGQLAQTDTSAPWTFTIGSTRKWVRGAHTLTAVASDAAGNQASASVTVYR